jgi:hypothetical protein
MKQTRAFAARKLPGHSYGLDTACTSVRIHESGGQILLPRNVKEKKSLRIFQPVMARGALTASYCTRTVGSF